MDAFARVDEWLRMASELSVEVSSETPRVDMSPEATDLRLRQAAELSQACLELQAVGVRAGFTLEAEDEAFRGQ